MKEINAYLVHGSAGERFWNVARLIGLYVAKGSTSSSGEAVNLREALDTNSLLYIEDFRERSRAY